jgi:hypothetical protein
MPIVGKALPHSASAIPVRYMQPNLSTLKSRPLRYFILPVTLLFFTVTASCQLDKGTWIAGGSGSFNSYHKDWHTPTYTVIYKNTDITISPSIGYFIMDRLAIGLRPSYLLQKQEDRGSTGPASGGQSNLSWLELGGFGRWYLLNKGNNYNILSDISYHYGLQSSFGSNEGHSNSFKALVGPVLYFSSSIGIELLVGYNSRREVQDLGYETLTRGFLTTIGFQIHLEKAR